MSGDLQEERYRKEAEAEAEQRGQPSTANDFLIGSDGLTIGPTVLGIPCRTRQQAYRTAAWFKLLGEVLPDEDPASTYDEIEQAIRAT